MQAIREVEPEMLRRYPNPPADAFRDAAAKVLGVAPDMIIAGNGSDDILTIATRTFVPPGDMLAYPDPTYSLYPVLAETRGAKVVAVAVGRGLVAADRGAGRDEGRGDLPRQSQRPQRHVRLAGEDRGTGQAIHRRWCWSTRRTSISPTTIASRW